MSTTSGVAFKSEKLRPAFDAGPGKYRIGLILLSSDYATERDFINMRPNDDVAYFSTRIPLAGEITPQSLASSETSLTSATRLLLPGGRLDAIAYSCTSASVVLGDDRVRKAIQAERPGIPCITPIGAALAGLEALGASRVTVITPYTDIINQQFDTRFRAEGLEIKNFASFNLLHDLEMANLTTNAIFDGAIFADHEDSDAVFISCTAIRAVDVIDRLEQKLGKPVVSSIQAMYWHSLRQAGCTTRVSGFGSLLQKH